MPSHHNQRGRSKKRGQYVPITHNMARSDAWRSLSGAATKVYIELRARHNGYYNGNISLSYSEASDLLTIGKSSVARAFKELEEKGFIDKTSQGRFKGRKASTWASTDRPSKPGELPSNRWQNWRCPKTDPRYCHGTMRHIGNRPANPPYQGRRTCLTLSFAERKTRA